jgi:hypothetical protein
VQLRNPDTAYIHEIAKLAEIPEKGKKFLIDYRNGCGKAEVIREAGREKSISIVR